MRTFNKNRIFGLPMLFALLIATVSTLSAQKPDNIEREKLQAIEDFRLLFSKSGYRTFQLTKKRTEQIKPQKCIELLQDDGKFSDLVVEQKAIELEKSYLSKQKSQQVKVGNFIEVAYNRIWRIAKLYKGKEVDFQDELIIRLCKAINNYSAIEAARGSITNGRFHTSCFAIPTAAVNTYFCLFQGMEAVENEQETSDWAIKANQSLLDMSYQSWTQPYRKDETDDNPVSVDRFRNHVWWVGGNGLGFRSLIPTAAAMKSIEMMDVLATVAKGGLSNVSQSTVDEAFWTEGFTADGAGWGHGMQNLIWGYPISGTSAALNLIEYFKGTPWAESLEEENAQALINYFRGSSWHYYKGYTPRCLDRGSMAYDELKSEKIKTAKMINTALDSWSASYSAEEQRELRDLKEDIKDKQVEMQGYQPGYYTGTRWFFNNDNLIRKNPDYYNFISMASVRCDGIEMAHNLADRYNFFTCDGATFFMKQGNEYHQAIGAWNLTAIPGVTARQGEDKLIPITNWRGYCSKHNFAAAATSSGKNAAAGFIFEKMNASAKKNVNDKAGLNDPNEIIYGVKVHKGYFMVDDYLIALGAGVTNLQPELDGEIWTTIDQTYYQGNTIEYFSSGSVQEGRQINLQLEDKDLVWAAQEGGFAYAVLPKYTDGSVSLITETRATKWQQLNKQNEKLKDLPKTENIFQMHIDHGKEIKDGKYAYIVYSGSKSASKAFKQMPLKIEANSKEVQAVTWEGEYLGAVFYDANAKLNTSLGEVSVSAPCAVLFERSKKGWDLTVTDAEMNLDIQSILVSTTIELTGDGVIRENGLSEVNVPMHLGKLAGKPAVVELSAE